MSSLKRIKVKEPKRNILTEYFAEGAIVKTTRSSDPLRAIQNAFGYLVAEKFGTADGKTANVVHVSHENGRLYSEIVLHKNGRVETTLQYDPRDFVTKGTLHYFKTMQKAEKAKSK